jgi:hypothetical protein
MALDTVVFAGVDLLSGRKPFRLVILDDELNVLRMAQQNRLELASCLQEYDSILLALNSTPHATEIRKPLSALGFKPITKDASRRWLETDAQRNFLALCEHKLLSGRTLEGRIQRALMLYELGLQIPDPMDFFEEITRYKLMQGELPLENSYSLRELHALMAGCVAWMSVNQPQRVQLNGMMAVLSARE